MKKIIITLLLTLLLAGCTYSSSETTENNITAEEIPPEKELSDFNYTLYSAGGATIHEYIGGSETVVVPAVIEGYPVTSIEGGFLKNSKAVEVTFSEGIKKIPQLTNCTAVETINLPSTVEEIGSLRYLTSLTAINAAKGERFKSIDGVLCTADGKTLISFPVGRCNSYKIPDGIEIIGERAFNKAAIKEVLFPESVHEIGDYAFADCVNLTGINLPQSLRKIGFASFRWTKLDSIFLPEGLEIIDGYAFSDTGLKELYVPKSVTQLSVEAVDEEVEISVSYPTETLKNLCEKENVIFRDETLLDRAIRLSGDFKYEFQFGKIFIDLNGDRFPEMIKANGFGNMIYYFDAENDTWQLLGESSHYWGVEVDFENIYYRIYLEEEGCYALCSDVHEIIFYDFEGEKEVSRAYSQNIILLKNNTFENIVTTENFIDLDTADIIETIDINALVGEYLGREKNEHFMVFKERFSYEPFGEIDETKPFIWKGQEISSFPYHVTYPQSNLIS